MSNVIKKIVIKRTSLDGRCIRLSIKFNIDNVLQFYSVDMPIRLGDNEDEKLIEMLNLFIEVFYLPHLTVMSSEQLRLKVTQGFDQIRANNLSGNSEESMEISSHPNKNVNIMPHVI